MIAVIVSLLAVIGGLVLGTGIGLVTTGKRTLGWKLILTSSPIYIICLALEIWLNFYRR